MLKPVQCEELTEKGRGLYYKIKPKLEKLYQADDVVLIEVESGDYFVGDTTIEAYKEAKKKYPGKQFFIAQIGQLAFRIRWRRCRSSSTQREV